MLAGRDSLGLLSVLGIFGSSWFLTAPHIPLPLACLCPFRSLVAGWDEMLHYVLAFWSWRFRSRLLSLNSYPSPKGRTLTVYSLMCSVQYSLNPASLKWAVAGWEKSCCSPLCFGCRLCCHPHLCSFTASIIASCYRVRLGEVPGFRFQMLPWGIPGCSVLLFKSCVPSSYWSHSMRGPTLLLCAFISISWFCFSL